MQGTHKGLVVEDDILVGVHEPHKGEHGEVVGDGQLGPVSASLLGDGLPIPGREKQQLAGDGC